MAGPRILVVDDNAELLTLLSSSFEEAGYAVQTATRGRSALELARKEKPDLVVVDVLLPDLMGYDVAEGLKRLRIPFIFSVPPDLVPLMSCRPPVGSPPDAHVPSDHVGADS